MADGAVGSGLLAGRDRELAVLRQWRAEALTGRGGCLGQRRGAPRTGERDWVRAGRRSVTVRATTRLRDPAGLRESVQAAVKDRLAGLDPLWPLRVKVRLRRKKG